MYYNIMIITESHVGYHLSKCMDIILNNVDWHEKVIPIIIIITIYIFKVQYPQYNKIQVQWTWSVI